MLLCALESDGDVFGREVELSFLFDLLHAVLPLLLEETELRLELVDLCSHFLDGFMPSRCLSDRDDDPSCQLWVDQPGVLALEATEIETLGVGFGELLLQQIPVAVEFQPEALVPLRQSCVSFVPDSCRFAGFSDQ